MNFYLKYFLLFFVLIGVGSIGVLIYDHQFSSNNISINSTKEESKKATQDNQFNIQAENQASKKVEDNETPQSEEATVTQQKEESTKATEKFNNNSQETPELSTNSDELKVIDIQESSSLEKENTTIEISKSNK